MTEMQYVVRPDNNAKPCDRCRMTYYPRIVVQVNDEYDVYLCAGCLADAIGLVTDWNIRKLLDQYASVSPTYQRRGEPSQRITRRSRTKE